MVKGTWEWMGRVCQMEHVLHRWTFPTEVSEIFRNFLVNWKRPLWKICYILKNGSHCQKWVTLFKRGHTVKNGSHCLKGVAPWRLGQIGRVTPSTPVSCDLYSKSPKWGAVFRPYTDKNRPFPSVQTVRTDKLFRSVDCGRTWLIVRSCTNWKRPIPSVRTVRIDNPWQTLQSGKTWNIF